jgi:hypothetical protein
MMVFGEWIAVVFSIFAITSKKCENRQKTRSKAGKKKE